MDIFRYPARIVERSILSDEELNALFKARNKAAEYDPFFWSAEISSNALDSYFTRMDIGSLRNFATDAQGGVPFLDSHNHSKTGYGRSLYGSFEEMPGQPPSVRVPEGAEIVNPPTSYMRTSADFYTVPNLKLNGHSYASTDDFMIAVKSGLLNDVSVGFTGGRWVCDITGMSYWSWDCPYIAGEVYEVERDGITQRLLSTVTIKDASLVEVSGVYAGATPNAAVIRKAAQEIEAGRANPKVIQRIEDRYKVDLSHRKNWPVGLSAGEERGKGTEAPTAVTDKDKVNMELEQRLIEVLGSRAKGDVLEAVDALVKEVTATAERVTVLETDNERLTAEASAAATKISELSPLADDGRSYRADLVSATLTEGVRAYGDSFSEDVYRALIEAAPLDTVKRMRDDWKALGDERFPSGRQTVDSDETNKQTSGVREVQTPDAAYQS